MSLWQPALGPVHGGLDTPRCCKRAASGVDVLTKDGGHSLELVEVRGGRGCDGLAEAVGGPQGAVEGYDEGVAVLKDAA